MANGLWGTITANLWQMVFGELTRWPIFGESSSANCHVGKSLEHGFWRTDTLLDLWRKVFRELTRWRMFGKWSLAKRHLG